MSTEMPHDFEYLVKKDFADLRKVANKEASLLQALKPFADSTRSSLLQALKPFADSTRPSLLQALKPFADSMKSINHGVYLSIKRLFAN